MNPAKLAQRKIRKIGREGDTVLLPVDGRMSGGIDREEEEIKTFAYPTISRPEKWNAHSIAAFSSLSDP